MHRIGRLVVCLGLFCLAGATHVSADPIVISAGFLLVTSPLEVGSTSLAGTQGFSLDAGVVANEGRVDVFTECSAVCLPGATISLGASKGGPSFGDGTATLAGNSYDLSGGVNAPVQVLLEFSATATLPALQDSFRVTAPFTASGWFSLPGDQIPMSGAGVVSLWLSSQTGLPGVPPGWVVDQVRYDFSDPAPVPEPATLTLLGIGLAATALRARIRGKEKAERRV